MKRNRAALRDVLLYVEEKMEFTGELQQIFAPDIRSEETEEEIAYAIYLLIDAGHLDGVWRPSAAKGTKPMVRAITSAGHGFLELVRNEEKRKPAGSFPRVA